MVNNVVTHEAIVIGGGQSGLATAWALQRRGVTPVVLEAGEEPVGSWPRYYDSLTLFSPARYSSLPGRPFPGDPNHYPTRDGVVDYLRDYAKHRATSLPSVRWTPPACHCIAAASRPPAMAWDMSGWNYSGRSRRPPCAASAATPDM